VAETRPNRPVIWCVSQQLLAFLAVAVNPSCVPNVACVSGGACEPRVWLSVLFNLPATKPLPFFEQFGIHSYCSAWLSKSALFFTSLLVASLPCYTVGWTDDGKYCRHSPTGGLQSTSKEFTLSVILLSCNWGKYISFVIV
jgi:hypothetical protein